MLLKEPKILNNGVVATWSEVVKTETDYNNKSSRATIYYYLDEQSFIDGKEPVLGEVIDVPFEEQTEMSKVGVTSKTIAEEAMSAKMDAVVEPKEEVVKEII